MTKILKRIPILLYFIPLLIFTCPVIAQNNLIKGEEWTRFRGPNGQGISYAKTIPVKWTENDYNWKTQLPGKGHSSPVIWKDRIFVTCVEETTHYGILVALNVASGKILWQKKFTAVPYKMHTDNSFASATPVVDKDKVYTLWFTPEKTILIADDFNGNEIWKSSFKGVNSRHGAGSSPVLINDLVVFSREQENGSSFTSSWVAVDKKTGKTRWQLERETCESNSFSTPFLYIPDNKTQEIIFTSQAHGLTGIEPVTGKVLWELKSAFKLRVVSSPVMSSDLLIGTSKKGLVAIKPAKPDQSIQAEVVYESGRKYSSYVPTPIVKNGLLYNFIDNGYVTCLKAGSGEVIWREKPAGKFYGSPVWVNGKLYIISRVGEVVVLDASEEYKLLAVNQLGEGSHTTPAISNGRMYLRTFSQLISIGRK